MCQRSIVDGCAQTTCLNGGTCIDDLNGLHCNCTDQWIGEYCEINVDDCVGVKCSAGKVCVDLINDYECRCPPGLSGDNCTIELDPCAKEPCLYGATCKVDENTLEFICICQPGYTGMFIINTIRVGRYLSIDTI